MIKELKFLIFFLFIPIFFSEAQKIEFLSLSNTSDSSFYDICRLSDNEFWIGGEHGILKTIDSTRKISSISYHNQGISVFKMLEAGNYLYIAADCGTIYKFNTSNHQLEKIFTSNRFKNYCFYDMILDENGKLIICGGKSKIVKAKYAIPTGFIIEVDSSFIGKVNILWKSKFNFVWSLSQKDGNVYASAFDGKYSKILEGDIKKRKFKKKYKINALVYKIIMHQDTLWMLGSKNIHFREDGFIGAIYKDIVHISPVSGKGCVWNMLFTNGSILAFTNDGSILFRKSADWSLYNINTKRTIYAAQQFNYNSILLVGNGKTIGLLKK